MSLIEIKEKIEDSVSRQGTADCDGQSVLERLLVEAALGLSNLKKIPFAVDDPSQHEVNKMVRILNGKKLKYTVRVHTNGTVIEFQANKVPKVEFYAELREAWLTQRVTNGLESDYGVEGPIMKWPEDGVLLVEVNPE